MFPAFSTGLTGCEGVHPHFSADLPHVPAVEIHPVTYLTRKQTLLCSDRHIHSTFPVSGDLSSVTLPLLLLQTAPAVPPQELPPGFPAVPAALPLLHFSRWSPGLPDLPPVSPVPPPPDPAPLPTPLPAPDDGGIRTPGMAALPSDPGPECPPGHPETPGSCGHTLPAAALPFPGLPHTPPAPGPVCPAVSRNPSAAAADFEASFFSAPAAPPGASPPPDPPIHQKVRRPLPVNPLLLLSERQGALFSQTDLFHRIESCGWLSAGLPASVPALHTGEAAVPELPAAALPLPPGEEAPVPPAQWTERPAAVVLPVPGSPARPFSDSPVLPGQLHPAASVPLHPAAAPSGSDFPLALPLPVHPVPITAPAAIKFLPPEAALPWPAPPGKPADAPPHTGSPRRIAARSGATPRNRPWPGMPPFSAAAAAQRTLPF